MKKRALAALAILAVASCTKESTTLDTTQVEAIFSTASITRVANNEWEANDKIGVTMTQTTTSTLATGDYLNIPYKVNAAGETGSFSADGEVIYLPTDGSEVDFYAYCPYSATLDANNDIDIDISSQIFSDIDIIAATVVGVTREVPTVTYSGDNAFKHQLSKISISLMLGEGISTLTGVTTTIKGQYTTAKYNILTSAISTKDDIADITAVTTVDTTEITTTVEAILIPTTAMAGSTIVFTLNGEDYPWDTSAIELIEGSEHNYEITLTKTGAVVSGLTIDTWGDGTDGTGTAVQ